MEIKCDKCRYRFVIDENKADGESINCVCPRCGNQVTVNLPKPHHKEEPVHEKSSPNVSPVESQRPIAATTQTTQSSPLPQVTRVIETGEKSNNSKIIIALLSMTIVLVLILIITMSKGSNSGSSNSNENQYETSSNYSSPSTNANSSLSSSSYEHSSLSQQESTTAESQSSTYDSEAQGDSYEEDVPSYEKPSKATASKKSDRVAWGTQYDFLSERYITEDDIYYYDKGQIRVLRNSIFARHGRYFKDPQLSEYFYSQSWYEPYRKEVPNKELNEYEKANIQFLKKHE